MRGLGGEPLLLEQRFVLEAEHRRGGMGTVWRARDLVDQCRVAIKLLEPQRPEQVERFARECSVLAELFHPQIVRYIAHGRTRVGAAYLAMEWLEGETVAERLQREPLNLEQSLCLLRGTLSGLMAAHARGIVHRDLKPSNLFLRDGRLEDVVLLDLGLARHLDANEGLTHTGSVLGTASYMAPEQARANGQLTLAADYFALGAIVFECLTGAPPFLGTHLFSVLAKLLFEAPPRLRSARPDLPESLELLVDRLLAKEAEQRLRDGDELLGALGALAQELSQDAPLWSSTPPVRGGAVHAQVSSARAAPLAPTERRPSSGEQALVSVILATPSSDTAESPETTPSPQDERGGFESGLFDACQQLADGTCVFTFGQHGGAATDLAVRAARCALRWRDQHPRLCFVVATGRGMLGARSHIGDAVDRAGTLLRLRAPNAPPAIWLDEVTAGLLDARFRSSRLPEGAVAFVLEAEEPSVDPERRLLGRPTPCVGRERELALLELTLAVCIEESSPRALLVLGPPGSGKSRLRHEFVRRAEARSAPAPLVLLGLADPIRTSSARGLIGNALSRLCGLHPERSTEDNRKLLVARIGRNLGGAGQLSIEFLGLLCGVEPELESSELRLARQDSRVMANLTARAWLDFVRAEARAQPVVLALDDLQWADEPSLALVERSVRELGSSPLLVLGLGRPELNEQRPSLWSPQRTLLPLPPLGPVATARFIRQTLGADVDQAAVARIVARAAGNALYLEELIRAEHARRASVPETVLAMLQARVGLLPPRARHILRAASVFGESFPMAGVQALVGDSEAEIERALEDLVRDEVIELDERATSRFRFRHSLLRDAVYSLFLPEDRAQQHALAGRFLEARADDLAVIALHFERGGDAPRAIQYFTRAAQEALRRNDFGASISLGRQGLAAGASGVARGAIGSILAQPLFQTWKFPEALAAAEDALACLPLDDPRRATSIAWHAVAATQLGGWDDVERRLPDLLAFVPEAHAMEYGEALAYTAVAFTAAGRRSQCKRLIERLRAIDASVGQESSSLRGMCLYAQARFARFLGDDPFLALELASSASQRFEATGHYMYSYMAADAAECQRRLGAPADAITALRAALQRARDERLTAAISYIEQFLACALAERGTEQELEPAREHARAVIASAPRSSLFHALGRVALAAAYLRDQQSERAASEASEALASLRRLNMAGYQPFALLQLLRAQARAATSAGAATADEALTLLAEIGPCGILDVPLRIAAAAALLRAGRAEAASSAARAARARLEHQASRAPSAAAREAFSSLPEHADLRDIERELAAPEASDVRA